MTTTRRTVLRRAGAAVAAGGLATVPAAAADCDATIYTNASEGGEAKLEVPAASDVSIIGESTCAPGTELSVRARRSGGSSPFIKTEKGVVQSGGGWAAPFDFSDQDTGQTFEVTVFHGDGTELDARSNCEVVSDAPTPHPTPSPTPTPTATATPAQADGSDGEDDGDSTTSTGAQGEPGTPTVTDEGTSTQAPTGTSGSDGTDGEASDGTDTPPDALTESPGGAGSPTGTGGPGFGLLAAAAGLAAAAWRLRDDS